MHAPTLATQQVLPPRDPAFVPKYHGTTGPIATTFARWFVSASAAFLPTLEALGVPWNKEPLGGDNIGGCVSLSSIDAAAARRSYSATAYLAPNAERPNLVVLTNATAGRIVFNARREARGVEFWVGGERFLASVTREVIVAAGTVQSPQILELSGIGGKEEVLDPLGIECVVDNPNVGENLQEHHCELYTPL